MDLKTYFQQNSQVDFARKIGVTPGAVHQWANGLSSVSAERCPQIEQATNGLVRCEDLRPDVQWSVLRTPTQNQPTPQAPPLIETVATESLPGHHAEPGPDALRTGTVRRQDTRRQQDPSALTPGRRHIGQPFQSLETGAA